MSRPLIALVLPRGEAIRNLLYSGVLKRLREACRLLILSVRPNDRVWRDLTEQSDELVELVEIPERWPPRFARELLDVAHGRFLWSEAAKERWRRRELEAASGRLSSRAKRLGKRLLAAPFSSASGVLTLSRVERRLSRRWSNTDHYLEILKRRSPLLLFNASHVHSRNAIQPVQAANWLGIPTAAFIFSWDNLTSQGRILPPYDHYLVWSERFRDQLLDIYPETRAENITVTGSPQFDCHFDEAHYQDRDSFCTSLGIDPERPLVLHTTGMPNHMPNEPALVEDMADRLLEMTDLGPPQLVVRVYPKDRSGRFEDLAARRADILFPHVPWEENWLTPLPEDTPLYVNLLRHAAVGVNIASTVSLELFLHDRPVVNVGYSLGDPDPAQIDIGRYYKFDHYEPLVRLGAVDVASSPAEMSRLLRRAIEEQQHGKARRRAALDLILGEMADGHASERITATLAGLATQGLENPRGAPTQ